MVCRENIELLSRYIKDELSVEQCAIGMLRLPVFLKGSKWEPESISSKKIREWISNKDLVAKAIAAFELKYSTTELNRFIDQALAKAQEYLPNGQKVSTNIYVAFMDEDIGGITYEDIAINIIWLNHFDKKAIIGLLAHEIHHSAFFSMNSWRGTTIEGTMSST